MDGIKNKQITQNAGRTILYTLKIFQENYFFYLYLKNIAVDIIIFLQCIVC